MARTRHAMAAVLALVVVAAAVPTGGLAATTAGGHPAAAGAGGAQDAAEHCSFPFSKVDATGTEVTVEEEPTTVVTLNPSAAQTMWEIGARDKVVGVSKYADYLEGAGQKTNISGSGFGQTVVVEKVVGLQPDLVLAPNTISNDTVGKLRDSGLTVYRFEAAKGLADIKEKTRLTGRLVGECDAADRTVSEMEAKLSTVREAVEGRERPDVLYVFGPSGYTAGTGTFIHTAIETAGGDNVAANANITFYKPISPEVVAARDPDWIVKPSNSPGLPKSDAYNGTTAIREGQVLTVNGDLISQPAPRIVQVIVAMAKALHPEAYAEANATATPTPSPTATPSDTATPMETSTPEPTPTPTPASGPGFGLAAALAALAAAALLARKVRLP